MLRIPSPLTDDLEDIVHRTIGCCIRVHRELGPGYLERIYCRAIAIELECEGVPYVTERPFEIWYKGYLLSRHFVDLVVGEQVILEVKAVDRLVPLHQAQVLSYLKASRLKVGLLLNFNSPVMTDGIKRIVQS